ncbi:acyltransferase family protein [Wenxinia saemankumensis]|uniref:Surface polysaccharide O-acyltransferase, integral membrane enzyme n=1 Tax=Wenxinia saemankumensis TaxID=1447782 RepID=A0A1M6DZ77_9RHOB|nr:acyltransferase [Wenxinia saemankumensis]SHI78328.1 Surface polysaccharide O-acyltransferase, integral membrane enzyme [Wenxinia saemankumensis]
MTVTQASAPIVRHAPIDVARLCLALVVVLGHGRFLEDIDPALFYGLVTTLGRLVVPFFLMVSGYFFLAGTRNGIGAWFANVAKLYLFWSAIYLPLVFLIEEMSVPKLGFYLIFGFAHLWYLPALAGGGLVLWLVRAWPPGRILRLALGLYLAGAAAQFALNHIVGTESLPHRNAWTVVPRNFLFMGFPFLAAGYVAAREGWAGRADGRWVAAAILALLPLFGLEQWANWRALGLSGITDIWLCVAPLAPLVFIAVLKLPLARAPRRLPGIAAAIYFVHPIFVFGLWEVTALGGTAVALISVALSLVSALLLVQANRIVGLVRRPGRREGRPGNGGSQPASL